MRPRELVHHDEATLYDFFFRKGDFAYSTVHAVFGDCITGFGRLL